MICGNKVLRLQPALIQSRFAGIHTVLQFISDIYLGRRFVIISKAFALLLQAGIVADVRVLMKNIKSVDKVERFQEIEI